MTTFTRRHFSKLTAAAAAASRLTRAYSPPGPPYTAEDIRFTQRGDAVYVFVGAWPFRTDRFEP